MQTDPSDSEVLDIFCGGLVESTGTVQVHVEMNGQQDPNPGAGEIWRKNWLTFDLSVSLSFFCALSLYSTLKVAAVPHDLVAHLAVDINLPLLIADTTVGFRQPFSMTTPNETCISQSCVCERVMDVNRFKETFTFLVCESNQLS